MTKKKMFYLVLTVLIVGLFWLGWKMTSRSGYESAEYKVVESDGSFEIREYPDLMLVTTSSNFESQGRDGSFGRLFQYISGDNDSSTKVSMTTPVFMEPDAEATEGQMGFVLPAEVVEKSIPAPTNGEVQIEKRAGGKFAVLRFSGQMDEKAKPAEEAKLRKWVEAKGLSTDGAIEFAGYDAPWTPGPLRRNEVLLRLPIESE